MSKKFNKEGDKITKGWGYEVIWVSNEHYCGKFLYSKRCKVFHALHKNKDETWFVNDGEFKLRYIDTKTATLYEKPLKQATLGTILIDAQSTNYGKQIQAVLQKLAPMDDPDDNYRVIPVMDKRHP